MLILAFVIVWIVWKIVMGFIAGIVGTLITIGMILLFCFLVYLVFNMLTGKQKNVQ